MPTGIYKRTEETRRKMSDAKKGEKHPWFGRKHTKESREKMSKSQVGNKNKLGKHLSEETRRKMSEAKKGEKHPLFGKHQSQETRKKISEHHINHPNRKFSNTSIERKVAEELTKRNIKFQQNIGVEGIANVDFLLGNKVIIQCDGCYWHNCKKHFPISCNKVNDKKQDKQLKKLGYKIYRFWEHEINESPEKCINKIL